MGHTVPRQRARFSRLRGGCGACADLPGETQLAYWPRLENYQSASVRAISLTSLVRTKNAAAVVLVDGLLLPSPAWSAKLVA